MGILAIHPGALGDVILFGQFVSVLASRVGQPAHAQPGNVGQPAHAQAQGAPITLVAGGQKAGLLAGLGVVDEALDFDGLPMDEVFSVKPLSQCILPRRLGRCGFLVSCLAAGTVSAQERLQALCGTDQVLFLPIRPPKDYRGHLVEYWRDLAGLEDVPVPDWSVPPGWRRETWQVLEAVGLSAKGSYFLIHPGAGSPDKCWPLASFMELARVAALRGGSPEPPRTTGETPTPAHAEDMRGPVGPPYGRGPVGPGCKLGKPLFVIGPVEVERWKQEALAELRGEFPVLVNPPLTVLAALAAGARAFVGNDSGPTHLAAAVGTPTVVVARPPQDVHFAPRGRRVKVLSADDLSDIGVDSVAAAVENV